MLSLDTRLLSTLRSASVHLTGSDLAGQLGVSSGEVDQSLADLKAAGFDIELRPGFGYRLLAAPDRLIADDLRSRLGDCRLVRNVLVFEETGSTNDLAMHFGRQGGKGGLVVLAERQTAGRGRFGRRWESASHKGLWFSLLLRPEFAASAWPRLTTWAALGVAAAVEKATRERAGVKWPNDVYLRGRKVAGILIELGTDSEGRNFAVVGIGVNVNHETSDFPPELVDKAGAARAPGGPAIDRTQLATAILRELDARFVDVQDDFPKLLQEAQDRSVLLGRWIQVHAGEETVEGMAEGLDEQGQLLLRRSDGELARLTAGEVTLAGR